MPTEDFKRNLDMDFFFMNNTNFIENQNKGKRSEERRVGKECAMEWKLYMSYFV